MTGGTEIQTLSLVQALIAAGHEVVVICYFEYTETMVRRYLDTGADVELLSADGRRIVGLMATTTFLWKGLRRVVRKYRPDVAHVQYMAPGALPILILRAFGVKKIIATAHTDGDIYSSNGLKVIKFLTNHVLSGFQCITERAERSYFGSSKLFDGTPAKHFTIYNNIPSHISILDTPRPVKDDHQPIVVGVVSRLESIKGMDLVIPAFEKATKGDDRLRLLVVGDGSQRKLMERQVKEASIEDRVEFVGRQPQSELQSFYDRIDILLMPSRSEGFGLTAIEGMARGCVPVVANVGGLPEVVTQDCGYLHNPEDIVDIAAKIVEGTRNIGQKQDLLINRGSCFSVENYNNQIKSLYSIS